MPRATALRRGAAGKDGRTARSADRGDGGRCKAARCESRKNRTPSGAAYFRDGRPRAAKIAAMRSLCEHEQTFHLSSGAQGRRNFVQDGIRAKTGETLARAKSSCYGSGASRLGRPFFARLARILSRPNWNIPIYPKEPRFGKFVHIRCAGATVGRVSRFSKVNSY